MAPRNSSATALPDNPPTLPDNPAPGGAVGIPKAYWRIRPTAEGFGFLLMWGLIGFAARHSGTNLVYLMFAMMTAAMILDALAAVVALRHLSVERRLPATSMAFRSEAITLIVRNGGSRVRQGIVVYDRAAAPGQPPLRAGAAGIPRLAGGETAAAAYSHVFTRRGPHRFGPVLVTTRHPFGLVEARRWLAVPGETVVRPAIHPVARAEGEAETGSGDVESRRRGEGSEFHGLREYRPDEPARRIHWRSSVKAGRPMVIEHERDEPRRLTLVLPPAPDGPPADPGVRERAAALAASLAVRHLDEGCAVGLRLPDGRRVGPATGPAHVNAMLDALATADTSAGAIDLVFDDNHSGGGPPHGVPATPAISAAGRRYDARGWTLTEGAWRETGVARDGGRSAEPAAPASPWTAVR